MARTVPAVRGVSPPRGRGLDGAGTGTERAGTSLPEGSGSRISDLGESSRLGSTPAALDPSAIDWYEGRCVQLMRELSSVSTVLTTVRGRLEEEERRNSNLTYELTMQGVASDVLELRVGSYREHCTGSQSVLLFCS